MADSNFSLDGYIMDKVDQLRELGMFLSESQISNMIANYSDDKDSEKVMKEIDSVFDIAKENVEYRNQYLSIKNGNHEFEDLGLEYFGLTINNQEIDLMRILNADTFEKLQKAIDDAYNIKITIDENISLEEWKEKAFREYLDSFMSKVDSFKNKKEVAKKRIDYLKKIGFITYNQGKEILKSFASKSEEDVVKELSETYGKDIWLKLKECVPVEKSGIKKSTIESINNLYSKLKSNTVTSITIDQEVKYGDVALRDGTFDFRGLDKALDFAKDLGKPVRLNALIFYMDCPDRIYNLDKTPENKKIAKDTLLKYVDEVTKHIAEYNSNHLVNDKGIVRSIDVFNELLNRFAMDEYMPYNYRGFISQDSKSNNLDNIKGGWSKFLGINDLCDIIAVARENLPNVDFMYNETTLEDPRKIEAFNKTLAIIREYEKDNGVKLVDSIGTQMHIDNDVSKEDIKNMFLNLNKIGLPIEITEFDVAMTHGVDGLDADEIELLRLQKINEVFDVIKELKAAGKCSIRDITIWSKTDDGNFRVTMKNEELIRDGKSPIETLHGGYYTKEYGSKNDRLLAKQYYQEYNYHTHTSRCGHAGNSTDRDYIETAKSLGMKTIGFSDHVPYPDWDYPAPGNRMHISEKDGYIDSIKELKDEYPDMTILTGYEAEYEPGKLEFLANLRKEVDYMILGQHYVKDGLHMVKQNDPSYPLVYAEALCTGMKSGLFDIVAHPDLFMNNRANMSSEEDKKIFDENSKKAFKMICETSLEMGIPLEFNLAGIDKKAAYPDKDFWKVASEMGVKVIVGADAHDPSQLINMPMRKKEAFDIVGNLDLNLVATDYNPVHEREKNEKLDLALKETVKSAESYEDYLSNEMYNEAVSHINKENKEINSENIKAEIETIGVQDSNYAKKAKEIIQDQAVKDNFDLALSKRKTIIEKTLESVSDKKAQSFSEGKTESKDVDIKTSELDEMLNASEGYENTNTFAQQMDKPKSLKLERVSSQNSGNSSSDNGNNSDGFINILSISTIIGFITFIIILFFIIITIIK